MSLSAAYHNAILQITKLDGAFPAYEKNNHQQITSF